MEFRKWQLCCFKEAWPADSLYPIVDALPVLRVLAVSMEDTFYDLGGFWPTRRIVWNPRGD